MSSAKELTASEKATLQDQIKELGDQIRALKTEKADSELVKERIERLKSLKAQLGDDFKMALKTPKGTRDYGPKAMVTREKVLKIVTETFKRHGAETIDTPVFELRDVLLGKYGDEGGKLVFDLADQGGELCSLRYDLTVPFARYVAMNKIQHIKRYHIAKVYRRDQPVMTKGRYREFYQCDFDIAGQYDLMLPEAECLRVVDEVLGALNVGEFYTKLNHRLLLEGIFSICGIAQTDFKAACSSIDKLDKEPWLEVRTELIDDKKIDVKSVDALEYYVRLREKNPSLDSVSLLNLLLEDEKASANGNINKAVEELKLLFEYLEIYGVASRVQFDPSLARGLDYYTGAIYETVMKDFSSNSFTNPDSANPEDRVTVGSVAAGGRYDKLVGMFLESAGKKKPDDVPCVGISFGIERLFSIMEIKEASEQSVGRTNETDVYVASAHKGLLKERMKLCRILWDAGVKTETSYKANPKLLNQYQFCEERAIPWIVTIGDSELQKGVVKVRNVASREEIEVSYDRVAEELKSRLS